MFVFWATLNMHSAPSPDSSRSRQTRFAPAAAGLTLVVCVAQALGTPAHAAPPENAPLPRELLHPSEQTAPHPQATPLAGPPPAPPAPCPFAGSDQAFVLRGVEVSGYSGDAATVEAAFAGYKNRSVTLDQICRLRDAAVQSIANSGRLARLDFPPQSLASGVLHLVATEARITRLAVRGAPPKLDRRLRALLGAELGRPLEMARLQRGLFLANDLPGVRIEIALAPDDQTATPGGLVLNISAQSRPESGMAHLSNSGSASDGRWLSTARLELDGWADAGSLGALTISRSPLHDRQSVAELEGDSRPWANGFVLHAEASYGLSRPRGAVSPLDSTARTTTLRTETQDWLVRDRREDVVVAAGLEAVDSATLSLGARLSQDVIRVAYVRTQWRQSWTGSGAFPGGENHMLVEGRQGLDLLGALRPEARWLSRPGADPQAGLIRLDTLSTLFVTPRLQASLAAHIQEAGQRLVAYETFGLGDATVGRGYDPSALSGDHGASISAELRQTLSLPVRAFSGLSLLAFYEAGRVSTLHVAGSTRSLASTGLGVEIPVGPRLNLSATLAHPLERLSLGARMPRDRLLVSLTLLPF